MQAVVAINSAVLGLFGDSPLHAIATDDSDEVYVMPRGAHVVDAGDDGSAAT